MCDLACSVTCSIKINVFLLLVCTVDRRENIDSVLQRDYTIENVLGTGGFGTVYSGIRKQDSKPVS